MAVAQGTILLSTCIVLVTDFIVLAHTRHCLTHGRSRSLSLCEVVDEFVGKHQVIQLFYRLVRRAVESGPFIRVVAIVAEF